MAKWRRHGQVASWSPGGVSGQGSRQGQVVASWATRGVLGKRLRHGKFVASLCILWRRLTAKVNITEIGRTSMPFVLTAATKHLVDFGTWNS